MPSLSASFLNLDHQPTWRLVWMAWRGRCLTLAWCQSKSFQREIVQSPWSLSAPPRREELGIWQVILSSVLSWATAKRQIPVEGRLLLLCWHHSMRKFSREKFRQTDLIEGGKNRTVRAVISLWPFSRLFWVKTAHAPFVLACWCPSLIYMSLFASSAATSFLMEMFSWLLKGSGQFSWFVVVAPRTSPGNVTKNYRVQLLAGVTVGWTCVLILLSFGEIGMMSRSGQPS